MIVTQSFEAAKLMARFFAGKANTEAETIEAVDSLIEYMELNGTWSSSSLREAHEALQANPRDTKAQRSVLRWVFLGRWGASGCPVVRMDSKWAASVCCSSVPKELWGIILPPWDEFILDIPKELGFKVWIGRQERVMCSVKVGFRRGTVRSALSGEFVDGWYISPATGEGNEGRGLLLRADQLFYGIDADDAVPESCVRTLQLLGPMIGAACMAFGAGHKTKAIKMVTRKTKGQPRSQYPTFDEWVVGNPVSVDLTEHVSNHIRLGASGGALKVQTLVRGHWKNQPCGPGSSERKFIHIEPYWRGPEDAPIAVRPHILSGAPPAP